MPKSCVRRELFAGGSLHYIPTWIRLKLYLDRSGNESIIDLRPEMAFSHT